MWGCTSTLLTPGRAPRLGGAKSADGGGFQLPSLPLHGRGDRDAIHRGMGLHSLFQNSDELPCDRLLAGDTVGGDAGLDANQAALITSPPLHPCLLMLNVLQE